MLSTTDPTNIDLGPTGLDYWLKRACTGSNAMEFHLLHRGAKLTIHPRRVAQVEKNGHFITVEGKAGRGWLPTFVSEVTEAIDQLEAGGGHTLHASGGHIMRDEIARRTTSGQRPVAEREFWFEWLEDDELPLVLGAWMHKEGVMSARIETSREPSLIFHPTHEEFDLGVQVSRSSVLYWTLTRLAIARGAPVKSN